MELRPSVVFAQSHFAGRSDLICMEVGVMRGNHAEKMNRALNPKMFYLVDIWEPCDWKSKGEDYSDAEGNYNNTKKVFEGKTNIILVRGRSQDKMPKMEENSFDFIYIDGDHDVIACRFDILNAIRLVKIGGIVGGHDFNEGNIDGEGRPLDNSNIAVPGAVYSVFKGMKIQSGPGDWWVVVNEEVKKRAEL